MKKFFASFILSVMVSNVFASPNINFVILPNVKTNYLLSMNADFALQVQQRAIETVKKTLDLNKVYKTVRIRLLYNDKNQIEALIVYLLSSQFKSVDIVRINVDASWNVLNVINNYQLAPEDFSQSPSYVFNRKPHCPDKKVQFVIGNNFDDESVETEVQRVFKAAKAKGYHPFMMNVNNPNGPQPTVQAYEDWMSCPNVKGFYNESHGYEQGILLTDDDFTFANVKADLVDKLKSEVILFDSCLTFHDPLLEAMLSPNYGNSQQYIAGIISLPFGASERAARCFWLNALDQKALTREMLTDCSIQEHLDPNGYGIGGNGDNHLRPASEV